MFSGANELSVFVHLGRGTVAELIGTNGTMPFEPRPGIPMKDYLQLTHNIIKEDQLLKDWLIKSGSYLQGRPAKLKKPKKIGLYFG
ncbi:MAG: hypothetical protein ACI959_001658 [Limisphaerales bacterium]|jgi:hypothetical protein